MKYTASQKLWSIRKNWDGYYFEIKLKGVVIDNVKILEPTLTYLKQEGVIKG